MAKPAARFRFRLIVGEEYQPLRVVPPLLWLLALAALATQILFNLYVLPPPQAKAEALSRPPSDGALRVFALGDPIALGRVLMLHLQAFDNQPGISIPFRDLDYAVVGEWLDGIVSLDARAEYPHFSAAKLYLAVDDPPRQRQMILWVRKHFLEKPNARWEWMAHATAMARYKIKDDALAFMLARELREKTRPDAAPGWARQMEIFFLENKNEYEAATDILSRQLLDGEVTDPHEFNFLFERLKEMLTAMGEQGEIQSRTDWDEKIRRLEELRRRFLGQFDDIAAEN